MKFRRQFLLTDKPVPELESWRIDKIDRYNLYTHHDLEVTISQNKSIKLILLGFLFDHECPEYSNMDILQYLNSLEDFDSVLKASNKYSGGFIIIYKSDTEFKMFNDAAAQKEIYYATDSAVIGSQPVLIKLIAQGTKDDSCEAAKFYSSESFKKKRLFIGDKTNYINIKHLKPNHYLDVSNGNSIRFFPAEKLITLPVEKVSSTAAKMLRGYLNAANYRYKLAMPVTAGWDTRVLFAASQHISGEIFYFIFKHFKLHGRHYDIRIPRNLLNRFRTDFHIIEYDKHVDEHYLSVFQESVDSARLELSAFIFNGLNMYFSDKLVINGNVSEIARNFYETIYNLNGPKLAFIYGYPEFEYVENIYSEWLNQNQHVFNRYNYNTLDMFYWEEKMGVWAAKAKTEYNLVCEYYSPFNSRELIMTLLSTKREHRDHYLNKLYLYILKTLSPDVLSEPINPCAKTAVIKILKRAKIFPFIYSLYIYLGTKYCIMSW